MKRSIAAFIFSAMLITANHKMFTLSMPSTHAGRAIPHLSTPFIHALIGGV